MLPQQSGLHPEMSVNGQRVAGLAVALAPVATVAPVLGVAGLPGRAATAWTTRTSMLDGSCAY